jgi:hypothetical protein
MNVVSAIELSGATVSTTDRAVRAALGMSLLTKIVIGMIMSPAAMFSVTVVAVFLFSTAIMGIDPLYGAWHALFKPGSREDDVW